MHHDILDVIKNVQDLYENNTSLGVLKDFERVLDEMDMYVYKNWEDGELAYGPKVDRHWITAGFMWPDDKMPDPIAGKRLLDLGCKIKYQKTHLVEPRKIRTPEDIRPGTKKGKLDHHPIWIVEIQMPKKLAFDIYKGYMNKMKEDMTDDVKPTNTEQNAPPPTAGAPAGAMPPGAPAPAGGAPSAPPAPAV
jgi:hypothetical protein